MSWNGRGKKSLQMRGSLCFQSQFVMMMMNVRKIEACLKAYQPQGLVQCGSYYSGEKLYADMLGGETFDLIFLDIELKAMNGVNLGAKIRTSCRTKKRTSFIYIWQNQSMRWNFLQSGLNFLIKPVQEQDIIKNLEKAMKLSKYYDDYIKFQRGAEIIQCGLWEVRYFSTTGRKVEIHTTSVNLDFYGKADDVEAKTPGFIRIHKSLIFIHEMYVKKWEYEMVVMNRDEQLSSVHATEKRWGNAHEAVERVVVHVLWIMSLCSNLMGILYFSSVPKYFL